MAEQEQPYQPVIHGLSNQADYDKKITCVLKDGRWTVEMDFKGQIVTLHDLRLMQNAIQLKRKLIEHAYRQELRKKNRLLQEQV